MEAPCGGQQHTSRQGVSNTDGCKYLQFGLQISGPAAHRLQRVVRHGQGLLQELDQGMQM